MSTCFCMAGSGPPRVHWGTEDHQRYVQHIGDRPPAPTACWAASGRLEQCNTSGSGRPEGALERASRSMDQRIGQMAHAECAAAAGSTVVTTGCIMCPVASLTHTNEPLVWVSAHGQDWCRGCMQWLQDRHAAAAAAFMTHIPNTVGC